MLDKKKLPNVFIVGTQKSGTTTLFDWIGQHPEVYGNPYEKDFPFFCDETVFEHEFDRFENFFKPAPADAKVILGAEANLIYVTGAVERMHKVIPNAKLVVILRNPVARSFSGWRHAAERDLETRSFDAVIHDEMAGIVAAADSYDGRFKNYLHHSLYAGQIEHLFKYYPRSQIKIVIYENLVADPSGELRELFEFIGVDGKFKPVLTKKNETQGGSRISSINKLVHRPRPIKHPGWSMVRLLFPAILRSRLREWLVQMNRVPAKSVRMFEKDRRVLQDYFAEDVRQLERLTGLNLEMWRD